MTEEVMSVEVLEKEEIGQDLRAGFMTAGRVKLLAQGLEIPDDLSFDEFVKVGKLVDGFSKLANESLQWWIGDLINYGMRHWPDVYGQAMDLTHYSYGTLMNLAYVARQIKPAIRNMGTFSHAMAVAPYSNEDQKKYLRRAQVEGLTVREMRLMIAGVNNYKSPAAARKEDPVGVALSAFNSVWDRHESQWASGVRPREIAFDVWKKCLEVVYKRGMG